MGISSQQVNKIMRGNENLNLKTNNKIEKTLNIQLVELKSMSDLAFV